MDVMYDLPEHEGASDGDRARERHNRGETQAGDQSRPQETKRAHERVEDRGAGRQEAIGRADR